MASFDIIINVTDKHVSTHIGHKSKYSTSKTTAVAHPGTENKIEGWKWGQARWPSYAELSLYSYIPVLFDGGETISSHYFQSGYGYDADLLLKQTSIIVASEIFSDPKNLWSPQVLSGSYYIYNKEWYLFSDQYITETLALPTHNISVLPLKDLTPIFVRRFGRNEETSQLYIAQELTKTVDDPADVSLTPTQFYLDVSNPDQVQIKTDGVPTVSETKTFTVTSDTKVVSLDTFPVNITSVLADTVSVWDGTTLTNNWVIDNDLGHVKPPDPHTHTEIVVTYTETFSVSYEPHFAKDIVSATSANVNPVHNGVNKGFVQITTEILEPFTIHLEADLPGLASFNQTDYELDLGNNVGKLIATVKNKVGTLLEGIRVYFDWDLPTDLSSITDANGEAFMYYNSPSTIDDIGSYVLETAVVYNVNPGFTTITVEDMPPGTPKDEVWIYALYNTDPFFGLKNSGKVDDYYEDYLGTDSSDEQSNEIAYREVNFIDTHSIAKPEDITQMTDPVKRGQKRLLMKEKEAHPFVHPYTGEGADIENTVWWPIAPMDIDGNKLTYKTDDLPYDDRLNVNSYFIVSNKLVTIRAYAYNNAGETVYSNDIRIRITLPDSVNGTYYSAALAEPFVSKLLRKHFGLPARSLEFGDDGFQGPPTVPFNYPGFYAPGTIDDEVDGNGDPAFVPLTLGAEVKIPIGFRVITPTSGITVASLLERVTFINPHGDTEEPT